MLLDAVLFLATFVYFKEVQKEQIITMYNIYIAMYQLMDPEGADGH